MTATTTPDLSTVPSPESLRPLFEAALAIMDPNDPARGRVHVGIDLSSDESPYYTVSFFGTDTDARRCFGSAATIAGTLKMFATKYKPLPGKSDLIAFHRAELAKLEAAK